MRFTDVLAVVWRSGAVSIGMALAIALVRAVLLDTWSYVDTALLLVPLGGVVYAGASLVFNRSTCSQVLSVAERILFGSRVNAGRLREILGL